MKNRFPVVPPSSIAASSGVSCAAAVASIGAKPSAWLAAAIAAVLLTACSTADIIPESKKIDYKSAVTKKLPSLEVPPDLTRPEHGGRFDLPERAESVIYSQQAAKGEAVQATAASSALLPEVSNMHIERAGTQRWLVVDAPAEQLWPQIKSFWQELGFIINIESPATGVMETDWAEDRAKLPDDLIRNTLGKLFDSLYSTSLRDKFRTRVENGAQPNSTEIYITHRGLYETYIDEGQSDTRWQPRPPDPDLEAEMLRRLMLRLGASEERADAQLAAAPTQARAELTAASDGAAPELTVLEGFDRAWRRVGLSLDRVGFTVEDRDRAAGLYFVRYIDPGVDVEKESKSWLSKLAFWRSDEPEATPQQRYRILVTAAGVGQTKVAVQGAEGETADAPTAQKILSLLFEQLK